MYILNGHTKRHKHFKRSLIWVCLAIILCAGAVFAAYRIMQPTSKISAPPKPVVTKVVDRRGTPQHVDQTLFTMDLPHDWQSYVRTDNPVAPAPRFSWTNTAENKGVRRIDMYIDAVPTSMALNRLQPVKAAGDHLELAGDTSDGCDKFTNNTAEVKASGRATANWQGVSFICDIGNYARHVVGIGTAAGPVNSVTLTGATAGAHAIFLTYTDASPNPDDSIFSDALQTLKLK